MDTVIVDGIIRKGKKTLTTVTANTMDEMGVSVEQRLGWNEIQEELNMSYDNISKRINEVSMEKARDMMIKTWHIDISKFVDVQLTG